MARNPIAVVQACMSVRVRSAGCANGARLRGRPPAAPGTGCALFSAMSPVAPVSDCWCVPFAVGKGRHRLWGTALFSHGGLGVNVLGGHGAAHRCSGRRHPASKPCPAEGGAVRPRRSSRWWDTRMTSWPGAWPRELARQLDMTVGGNGGSASSAEPGPPTSLPFCGMPVTPRRRSWRTPTSTHRRRRRRR